ncbi:MAG: DUF5990 family protein [Caulobacter sp.]|nr:DUF5990 family protein [Caulobacter sp.]
MSGQTLNLRITLVAPPAGVLYSLQEGDDLPVGKVLSDGGDLSLDVSVRFVEDHKGVRYLGPFVKNQGGRRFVYFRIGASAGQHGSPWSRRGKVWFEDLPEDLAREAARTGARLEARFPGTGKDGTPACATVRPIGGWRTAA